MCLKLCAPRRVKLKDGKIVTLRRPRTKDVKQLKNYINALVDEDAQILINERMTLKGEKEWLKEKLNAIRKNKLHCLVAVYKGEIIGNVELRKGKWRKSHVAELGISVKRGYRRLGLASEMTKVILYIGRRDKGIKVFYLTVFPTNKAAIKLYKKFGFKRVAVLKNRATYKGRLVDEIFMDLK